MICYAANVQSWIQEVDSARSLPLRPARLSEQTRYLQAFPTSPDDVRRHLVAYAEHDSMRERLQRSRGLKGRGEFSDRMESDEEWDSRPE